MTEEDGTTLSDLDEVMKDGTCTTLGEVMHLENKRPRPSPHPALSYLKPSPPLVGQSLYLGGENGPDGLIYCIPGHATRVLQINPFNDECIQIGPEFVGKFKWLRGIQASNGIMYGLPCNAPSVLRIDARNKSCSSDIEITTLELPYHTLVEDDTKEQERQRTIPWKYHGGSISPVDDCIYCIPQSATRVLRIDPQTDECTFVGPRLPGKYKWYGGVVGKDGAIYGTPHNSQAVLRICPRKNQDGSVVVDVQLVGDLGDASHQWHGAGVSSDGTIVCIPANTPRVLLITPPIDIKDPPTLEVLGDEGVVATGENAGRPDRKYKYLGAVSDPNNNVYCLPSGTERVLRVNTQTKTIDEIGPSLYVSGMERLKQNKWQNGFYCPKSECIYAIPLAAETVLKIDLKHGHENGDPVVSTMGLPAEPFGGLAKWEGGVMAETGVMYCMPNNFKRVLRIEPMTI